MKKIIALFNLCLLVSGCGILNTKNNEILQEKLKGKVKVIKEIPYEVTKSENGEILNKKKIKSLRDVTFHNTKDLVDIMLEDTFNDGKTYLSHTFSYLNNNSETFYGKKGEIQKINSFNENDSLRTIYRITNNKRGKPTEIEAMIISEVKKIHNWTKSGKVIKEKYIDSTFLISKYKYNKNNDLVGYITFFKKNRDKIFNKTLYEYVYNSSNIIKKNSKFNDSSEVIETFVYNKANQKIEHYKYYSNEEYENTNWVSKETFDYDNNKNTVNKTIYNRKTVPEVTSVLIKDGLKLKEKFAGIKINYKYVFDKEGNWISKTIYNLNKPKYLIERKIEYY